MTDFKPMLAGKFPGDSKLRFPLVVQPKLDGVRCIVKDSVALSRTLKPIPNAFVQKVLGTEWLDGFDGELLVGPATADDVYRKTVSGVMRDDGEPDFKFWVFDTWNHGGYYHARRRWLENSLTSRIATSWIGSEHPDRIRLVSEQRVDDLEHLYAAEQGYIDVGYEGAILRGPVSFYKFGRGNATNMDLLKVKRFTDSEAVVIGVYEEMHNANEATTNALGRTERSSHQTNKIGKGTLGGLIVRLLHDHAGFKAGTEFRVGTGFSADERAQIWRERDKWPGTVIRFKHFEVGAKDKPRHPVYQGIRAKEDLPDGD
jgi:DNA ligase-1